MKLRKLWGLGLGMLWVLAACSRPTPPLDQNYSNLPAATAPNLLLPTQAATSPGAAPSPAVLLTQPTLPPAAFSAEAPLRAFEMVDRLAGWGAGDNAVLHTSDGGRTWQAVTPAGQDLSGAVPQVYAIDARSAWLLVPDPADFRQGMLLRTRDGGLTWQQVAVPFGGGAVQILDPEHAFVMADRGVAAGSHAVEIFASSDGGEHWASQCKIDPKQSAERCLPFGGNKNGITFRDLTHGWLGGFVPVDGSGFFYATSDGGKTWRPLPLPPPVDYEKAQFVVNPPRFFGTQFGVVVVRAMLTLETGEPGAAKLFYLTHDDGQTWQVAPALRSAGLVALATVKDWFVWDGGVLQVTQNAGQTWQSLQPDVDLSEKLAALQFMDQATGWALSMDGDDTRLYRTTDGGRTWH